MRTGKLAFLLMGAAAIWLYWRSNPAAPEGSGRRIFGLWRTSSFAVGIGLAWCSVLLFVGARSRKTLNRMMAVHVGLGVVWASLELIGIAGLVDYAEVFRRSARQQGRVAMPNIDVRGSIREDIARRYGIESDPIPYRFTTDAYGLRNVETLKSADFYCLGDSFLVAGIVPYEETLVPRLTERLRRTGMNISLVGLAPQECADLFRSLSLPLEGRTVLQFVFEGNDLLDSARYRSSPSQVTRPRAFRDRLLTNQVVLALQRLTQPRIASAARRRATFEGQELLFRYAADSFRGLESECDAIQEGIAELRAEVEGSGASFGVVVIPSKIRVFGPLVDWPEESEFVPWTDHVGPLPESLASFCQNEGIEFFDLTECLRDRAREGSLPWFPGDTHWNADGIDAAAEALASWPFLARLQQGSD